MTWRYAILKTTTKLGTTYEVCEKYMDGPFGYTGAILAVGDSVEELVETLEMMLSDVKRCIIENDYIEEKDVAVLRDNPCGCEMFYCKVCEDFK